MCACRLDRHALPRAVVTGKRREPLIKDVEEWLGTSAGDEVRDLPGMQYPDGAWEVLLRGAGAIVEKHFPAVPARRRFRSEETGFLLCARRSLRRRVCYDGADEDAVAELRNLTRAVWRAKRRDYKVHIAQLVDELQQAWRVRDMSLCCRLMRAVAGGYGPKFRH